LIRSGERSIVWIGTVGYIKAAAIGPLKWACRPSSSAKASKIAKVFVLLSDGSRPGAVRYYFARSSMILCASIEMGILRMERGV
jgi:hypothetical protein